MDLLALNFNSPSSAAPTIPKANTTPQKSDQEALLDIFGGPVSAPLPTIPQLTTQTNTIDSLFSSTFDMGPPGPVASQQPASFAPITSVTDNHMQFLFKNSDMLVDHAAIKIFSKAEYKRNIGRLVLDITNKSSFAFMGFQILPTDDPLLKVSVKQLDSGVIQPGATVQVIVSLECVNEFSHMPQVYIQFRYSLLFMKLLWMIYEFLQVD